MSLIADALRRAQRSVAGANPPAYVSRRASRTSTRASESSPLRRLIVLVAALGAVAALAIGGMRLLTADRKPAAPRIATAPPLLFDQTPVMPAPGPKQAERQKASPRESSGPAPVGAGSAARPKPRDATTVTDVLAALQLKEAEPKTRVDPRRERALQRATEALEGDGRAGSAVAAPPPTATTPKPSTSEAGPAAPTARATPAPTVEVHAAGPEAARFFAEGLRHQRERRYPQAIEEYEKAIAADPGNLEAYNNLGVVYKEGGRLDQAAGILDRALALDAKYEKALNNLGVVRHLRGQHEEAIGLFRRAIVINPDNVESHTNLGIIYLLAERLEEARDAFERALRLDPKHAETHYNLALLYERRGIWPRALHHYQRFLELAQPRHATFVAKVRERLRTLAERK